MAHVNTNGQLQGWLSPPRVSTHRVCAQAGRCSSSTAAFRPRTVRRDISVPVASSDTVTAVDSPDKNQAGGVGLTTQQVQSLLTTICEETDIAELRLEVGDYELNVRRLVGPAHSPAPVPAAAPLNGASAQTSITPGTASIEDSLDEESTMSVNESLLFIESPKVGLMRRGMYNKSGKKVGEGPKVGDLVKKGATLCFIEQLGTYCPVIAPQQGELSRFEVEDGAPVEYREAVVELAPYFGGHIIGDMKYA